jgi:small subunit ribosomal protein S17
MAEEQRTTKRKTRQGVVVSDKGDKTIIVSVERPVVHPKYGKILRRRKRYAAHDEQNECHTGDTVRIMETRPLSKTKRWRLAEIVTRAK